MFLTQSFDYSRPGVKISQRLVWVAPKAVRFLFTISRSGASVIVLAIQGSSRIRNVEGDNEVLPEQSKGRTISRRGCCRAR